MRQAAGSAESDIDGNIGRVAAADNIGEAALAEQYWIVLKAQLGRLRTNGSRIVRLRRSPATVARTKRFPSQYLVPAASLVMKVYTAPGRSGAAPHGKLQPMPIKQYDMLDDLAKAQVLWSWSMAVKVLHRAKRRGTRGPGVMQVGSKT